MHPELWALRALARPAHSVRLRGPRGEELGVELEGPIDVYDRRSLDGALLERAVRAGAEHRAQRVRRVRVDDAGAELELDGETPRFDFVIGADGASSVVRRSLIGAIPIGRAAYATAGAHVEGLEERELYVEFVPEYPGYLWVFPRPDHCSVGIAAPLGRENGVRLRARVERLLAERYPEATRLPRHRYAMSIPAPAPRDSRAPLGGPRFALAGDAALAVDAITGEGIHHALCSGALLARALDEAGPLAAARRYRELWDAGLGRDLARAARLAASLYFPAAVSVALRIARRSRRARGVMRDMLMGMQPYHRLGRRLLHELAAGPAG
jgi:flavin-dependent dehydrogenase